MKQKDGFNFTKILYPFNHENAIRIELHKHSVEDYVRYINDNSLEQAEIIMPNFDFLTECPTLKFIKIQPHSSSICYDYTPLYNHPEIKFLHCINEFCLLEGKSMSRISELDYSRIQGLTHASLTANHGSINFSSVETLKSLVVGGYCNEGRNLSGLFCSKELDTLSLLECKETSLEGIETSENMQCLYISYNRVLRDIEALYKIKDTLKALRIVNCPKILDFSVLSELNNLELLEISGNNTLQSISFIKKLKKLKSFVFDVNIADGDLTPCLNLSYAQCRKARRHYSHKDKELPKGIFIRGNESIEDWRKLE